MNSLAGQRPLVSLSFDDARCQMHKKSKRHQAETAAELDALLPAVLERAFRGGL